MKEQLEQKRIFNTTSFLLKIQKYNRNEPKCNDVYSRNYLSKIKNGEFVINLDECISIGIHWIALHVSGNNVIYFDIFGVEYIPKEIKKL